MRCWSSLLLLGLFVGALAQEQRITLTVLGATPRNTIAQIAELTGEKLEVADNINLCTLVLRLDDVLLEDALSKIAEVTIGYWAKVGDRRILRLDQERTNSARAESLELMKTSIAEQNARALESLEPWETYRHKLPGLATQIGEAMFDADTRTGSYGRLMAVQTAGVERRLVIRLAAALPAEDLVALESGERVVYSSHATAMQRPMPASARAAIEQFQIEYEEWQRAAVDSLQQYPVVARLDPRVWVDVAESPPNHIVLAVINFDFVDALVFMLQVYDDKGQIVSDENYSMRLMPAAASAGSLDLPDIELTTEDLEFATLMSNFSRKTTPDGRSIDALSAKYLRRFEDATTDDPISFIAGPALVKVAQMADHDLVACLPDAALFQHVDRRYDRWESKMTGQALLQMMDAEWACAASEEDGWLLVTPKNPVLARQLYLRRGPLADLVKSMVSDRTVTLEAAYRYARQQEGGLAFRGLEGVLSWIASPVGNNYSPLLIMSLVAENTLAFLGALSDEELDSAFSASGVSIGLLNKGARSVLASWLFAHRSPMRRIQHSRRERVPASEFRFDTPRWIESMAHDALPQGIPPGSTLRVWIEEKVLLMFKVDGSRMIRSDVKDQAGMWLLDDPATGRARTLQPGKLQVVHVQFTFGPDVTVDNRLYVVPPIGAKWFTLDELPAELRDELILLREEAARERASRESQRSQANPPPKQ